MTHLEMSSRLEQVKHLDDRSSAAAASAAASSSAGSAVGAVSREEIENAHLEVGPASQSSERLAAARARRERRNNKLK